MTLALLLLHFYEEKKNNKRKQYITKHNQLTSEKYLVRIIKFQFKTKFQFSNDLFSFLQMYFGQQFACYFWFLRKITDSVQSTVWTTVFHTICTILCLFFCGKLKFRETFILCALLGILFRRSSNLYRLQI